VIARRAFLRLGFLGAATLGLGLTRVWAKPVRPRVFMVLFRGETDAERGFRQYFAERGHPLVYQQRDCGGDPGRLPEIAAELRSERPDLVYAFGTTVTRFLVGKEGVAPIPLVFAVVADPVGAGIVKSLAGSGGSFTGVSHLVPAESQVRAMRSVVEVRRIGAVLNPREVNAVLTLRKLAELGPRLGFVTRFAPARLDASDQPEPAALPALVDRLIAEGIAILYLPSDSFVISNARVLVGRAHGAGVPPFSATEESVRRYGALMGLVVRYNQIGQFAAYKAEQILFDGADPGDIPVQTLDRFSFLI
jgi:putative ABC transport system substrate-binding protein